MAQGIKKKGTIGILTGGGDVPGLNPAIRGVTIRALREGYQVIGLRRDGPESQRLSVTKMLTTVNTISFLQNKLSTKPDGPEALSCIPQGSIQAK